MVLLFRALKIMVLCGFLVLMSGCRTELFGRLSEADANAVMVVLYSNGIDAAKVRVDAENWRIELDEQDHQQALMIVHEHGVPRERFASLGELFKKDGLISTPSEVRMRYIYALSQELSSTLSQIDGVVSARVHPVIPENDPLSDKVSTASAEVFIKHLPDVDIQQMTPSIKMLVARSIEGLVIENVSLTFFVSKTPSQLININSENLFTRSTGAVLITVFTLALLLICSFLGWKIWRDRNRPRLFSTEFTTEREINGVELPK
jgi:type III secretion protein J